MPLLVKELSEIAARRRTYVLRVLYALALYGVFAVNFARSFAAMSGFGSSGADPQMVLFGFGQEILHLLIGFQFAGIMLLQPAFMCGRITQEKERDSLVLLFLTDLRPWEIVWQKYLGGLVPMLSCLLLGLPLAGVAYAFGGLEGQTLVIDWLALLLSSLQIGALALLCSAWCRSTVGALISSYLLMAILYFGPGLLSDLLRTLMWDSYTGYTPQWWEHYLSSLVPTGALDHSYDPTRPAALLVPPIVSIALFLLATRYFLVRRAAVPALNLLPRLFALIDRLMKRANRLTGGILILRDVGSLPGDEPVFWRETQRRALGKLNHLLRLFCVFEVPTALLCLGLAAYDPMSTIGLSVAAAVVAILAVFTLATTAANSLVAERVGQTLDVLLTTPLSARDIIRQKERALRRLEWILAVPLLTIFASEAYLRAGNPNYTWNAQSGMYPERIEVVGWLPYFTGAILILAIYLPMITWLSLWIGLRVRTRFQAIITALGSLIFWIGLCVFALHWTSDHPISMWPAWLMLLLLPFTVPALHEMDILAQVGNGTDQWAVILLTVGVFVGIAFGIRFLLFADAEHCLRR